MIELDANEMCGEATHIEWCIEKYGIIALLLESRANQL